MQAREAIQQSPTSDGQEKEYAKINKKAELTSRKNAAGSDMVGGTGIKIKARQPQQPLNSDDSVTPGTAPRRIWLQMNISPGSVADSNVRDTTSGKEDGVHSTTIDEVRIIGKANIWILILLIYFMFSSNFN